MVLEISSGSVETFTVSELTGFAKEEEIIDVKTL